MRIITCRCERSFDAELPELVDLDAEPGTLDKVLEGSFFALTCPHCGERIKPELPVALRSAKRGLSLRVLPEGERSVWLGGGLATAPGEELLIGYAELYERALILREGLEARAVELLKYYILAKALEGAEEAETSPLVSFRGRGEDGRLSFGIEGLRKGELALLALPFDRYEKAKKDLSRLEGEEPFSLFLRGPYRSVRALEAV